MKKQFFVTGLLMASLATTVVFAEESSIQGGQNNQAQDMMASNGPDNSFAPAQPEGFSSTQQDENSDSSQSNADSW